MYSVKSLVYQYINNDYNIFYTCICRYKYTDIELKRLCNLSLHNLDIDIIYGKRYYDLRYIFELLYRRRDIYNSIQIDNNKMNTIVKNIKTCYQIWVFHQGLLQCILVFFLLLEIYFLFLG